MATQRFLLKVLNGLYRDSELPLEQGGYTFGSSADNDINIEDPSLREKEGRLIVSESGVSFQLEAPAPAVYVGGQLCSEMTFDLNPYEAVYLNEFCFVVGREGESWPEIDLERRDASRAEQEADTDVADSAELDSVSDLTRSDSEAMAGGGKAYSEVDAKMDSASDPMMGNFEALLAEPDDSMESEKKKKGSNWRGKLAFVLLFFMVLAVAGFVSYSFWKANKEEEVQREQQRISNEEIIKDVIARSGLKIEIREPEVPGGKPRLVGYIASEKERAALIADLDKMKASYQSEVYVVEQMLQAGYSLLNAFAFDGVDLAAGRRYGTLVAKGYIENLDRWLKIKVVIERDIEGLLSLIDEVDTPAGRLQKLEQSISRAGLDREVKLYLSPDGLILARTSLSPENEPKWKILEDAFKKSFGNQPRLVTLIDDNNWIKIIAINFSGPVPYIVLEDGRKYIEGSNLDNGYKLKEISEEGVILQGQFGERVMPLKLTQ